MNRGRTVITRAAPETTDDEEARRSTVLTQRDGDRQPFLQRFALRVEGEVLGRTRVTEARPETSDEADPARRRWVATVATRGRTITTRTGAETSDDEPRG